MFVIGVEVSAQIPTSSGGFEYWIAIPPNEEVNFGSEIELALEICALEKDASVYVEIPFLQQSFVRKVVAGASLRLSSVNDDLPWELEVRSAESAVNKSIYLQSDAPISARVYSARSFSSDAFTALPVHMWGRNYRHLAYYEEADVNKRRGAGFLVVAAYDNTDVNIELQSAVDGPTSTGTNGNADFIVPLQRGEVYMVHGGGEVDGFDLSGSLIRASKPVGLISFHMRSIVPLAMGGGDRDFLVEMLPPLDHWGRLFVARAFDRSDFGDFFRVMAAEDDTQVSLRTYDPLTGEESQNRSFDILQAGDFLEFGEHEPEAAARPDAIRGISVWEADKAIQVMMYSYSSNWDGAPGYNPFMVALTPMGQAVQSEIVAIPTSTGEAVLDVFSVAQRQDLEALTLNGQAISLLDNVFLDRTYSDNAVRCSRIRLAPGVHRLEGPALFVGMLHTIGGNSIHGLPLGRRAFPMAGGGNTNEELPQVEQVSLDCFSARIDVTAGVNMTPLSLIRIDAQANSNIRIVPSDALEIDPAAAVTSRSFLVEVIDRSQNAILGIDAFDQRGAKAGTRFEYRAANFSLTPSAILYQDLRTGDKRQETVSLRNLGSSELEIEHLRLLHGNRGIRIQNRPQLPAVIDIAQELLLTVESSAAQIGIVYDTLVAGDYCRRLFELPIEMRVSEGIDGEPLVFAADFDFGDIRVGSEFCAEIPVRNVGSELLIIDCITDATNSAFVVEQSGCDVFFPQSLPVDSELLLKICFAPLVAGDQQTTLLVQSNARGIDSLVFLFGRGLPRATSVAEWHGPKFDAENGDWDGRRAAVGSLSVFPNPAAASVNITWPAARALSSTQLRCFDYLGRAVPLPILPQVSGELSALTLDVSALAAGLYVLTLGNAEEMLSTTLVIAD